MLIDISTKLVVLVTLLSVLSLREASAVATHRRYRRQVPQEWAHAREVNTVDTMLKLDNPLNITHPIFSLLGNDAAAKGMGKIDQKNIDCFQKIVADQAFKNAKAAGNKAGQEAAIIFASLEKNTKNVGVASPPCASKKMENPEIERLIQHQDAASKGAKEINKKSALLAALSLSQIGSDPLLAFNTGTFKAGDPKNNKQGKGESCDIDSDPVGCIYTKNLMVVDVTKEEVDAFLKQHAGAAGGNNFKAAGSSDKDKNRDAKPTKDGGATSGKDSKLTEAKADTSGIGKGNATESVGEITLVDESS
ncbi:hypothetical protein PCASD_06457 [Puccinia coronata f. sp. avenae]|uniref:Uncharacterized protein n=1 Tax=Puccinia coronata f. sp. avenae TaxID=200324 RepID=A0A2N5UFM2_9BASI|nr:hypothetical protein PCASD_06457 [Puccinia coronata f. sp. avenae]